MLSVTPSDGGLTLVLGDVLPGAGCPRRFVVEVTLGNGLVYCGLFSFVVVVGAGEDCLVVVVIVVVIVVGDVEGRLVVMVVGI